MSKIYPYAGFWKRFGAFIVDSIVLTIPTMLIYGLWFFISLRPLIAMDGQAPSPDMITPLILKLYGGMFVFQIISLVIFWLYYAWMESSAYQATLGKMVFGIKVVGEQGQRISFWHATGRTLGKFVSGMTFYIGFLMAGANKHKQALHDIMATTFVVSKNHQEGEPLPEVQTHYVLLGVSIAGMLLAFLLPFLFIFFFAFNQAMNDMKLDSTNTDMPKLQRQIQDNLAMSKISSLQSLPKEQQQPFTEDEFDYTFLSDGTVRAQRTGEATYAFIMKPDTYWPCCQPLVPDGCASVVNADVCQAK